MKKEGCLIGGVCCETWEELIDILASPLLNAGVVTTQFVESAKGAVKEFGAYVVLIDDIAFFHGKPGEGVHELALTLALLKKPIFLLEKRIKVAFLLAAVDNVSHRGLLKELSAFMTDEACLELLLKGEDSDTIMAKFSEVEGKV